MRFNFETFTHQSRRRQVAVLVFLLFLSLPRTIRAGETELLNKTINGTTAIIVRFDPGNVQLPPQFAELARQDTTGALAKLTSTLAQPLHQVRQNLDGEVAFFALDMPYTLRIDARLHASTKVPEKKLRSVAQFIWPGYVGSVGQSASWHTVPLCTSPGDFSKLPAGSELIPLETEAWKAALDKTGDCPVQLAVIFPRYFRETFAEIYPELPPMLGGGSAKTLVSGVRWISVGIRPATASIRMVVQTESPAVAQEVKTHLPKMLSALLKESQPDLATSTLLTALLGVLEPTVSDDQVIMKLDDPKKSEALMQLAAATVTATAKPIAVSQTQNNLKRFCLAMHNYFSAYKAWPTYRELKTQEKKSGLSWRVHILPFMNEAELYKEFKLDESWDSPHNIRLLDRMPKAFKPAIAIGSEESVKPFHTTYAAPVGEDTVFGRDKVVGFQHVTDGTSNTIVLVELETEAAIPWTSPEEYAFDPARPAAKLRSIDGKISTAFMDGSVRGVRDDEPASVWNALFSIDGREMVSR